MSSECNEKTHVILVDRVHEDVSILVILTSTYDPTKNFWSIINRWIQKESRTDMESATFVELKTAQALAVLIWFAPSKSTTTIILYFAIIEFLIILSEFNLQYINRSVCEFYMLFMILRMPIKKAHHQTNQENWFRRSCFVNQNQVLELFISMKIDAECNETTPEIAVDRFHEDSNNFSKMTTNKKSSTQTHVRNN